MQNSVERLLEAISALLGDVAASQAQDAYLAAQLSAAAEILDNLAPRVEWRGAQLRDGAAQVRRVLALAVGLAGAGELDHARGLLGAAEPGAEASGEDLMRWRDQHLAALVEVQEWPGAGRGIVAEAIAELLGWQLAHERALVRRGTEGDRGTVTPEEA